jgi:MEMO1 family protein
MHPTAPDRSLRVRALEAFPVKERGETRYALRDPAGLFEGVLVVTRPVVTLLELLDGRRTRAEIATAWAESTGETLPIEELDAILQELSAALVLEGPAVDEARARALAAYRASPARAPMAAGSSYPEEPEACRAYLNERIAAASDAPVPDRVAAVLAPHIDLRGGGACHGAAARALARCSADVFVVIGTAHAAIRRPFALTTRDFATPVGTVRTNRELVERLASRGGGGLLDDELAHRGEHSVEFQALWLAHVLRDRPRLSIVPVLAGSLHERIDDGQPGRADACVADFVDALRSLHDELGDRVAFVASVDFAHVGPKYGDAKPVGKARLAAVMEADRALLVHAAAVDADGWLSSLHAEADARNVCGASPTWTLLEVLRGRGLHGTVLRHDEWEIDADTGSHVSFAAVAYS